MPFMESAGFSVDVRDIAGVQDAAEVILHGPLDAKGVLRYRGLYGAGHAAMKSGNSEKARFYFSRLSDMAGNGLRPAEAAVVRQVLAKN